MKTINNFKMIHSERLDQPIKLSKGLKAVLGTTVSRMSRFEIMDKIMDKIHFFRLHNILGEKNYKIPKSWQKHLSYPESRASETDLLEVIAKNIE